MFCITPACTRPESELLSRSHKPYTLMAESRPARPTRERAPPARLTTASFDAVKRKRAESGRSKTKVLL